MGGIMSTLTKEFAKRERVLLGALALALPVVLGLATHKSGTPEQTRQGTVHKQVSNTSAPAPKPAIN